MLGYRLTILMGFILVTGCSNDIDQVTNITEVASSTVESKSESINESKKNIANNTNGLEDSRVHIHANEVPETINNLIGQDTRHTGEEVNSPPTIKIDGLNGTPID